MKPLLGILGFVLAGLVALAQFTDPEGQFIPAPAKPLTDWIWANRLTVTAVSLVVFGIASGVGWVLEVMISKRPSQERLKRTLDDLEKEYFTAKDGARLYRVTLFKVRILWLHGKWLGIIERSGGLYKKCDTIFSINEDDERRCTGLVGRCWWLAMAGTGSTFRILLPDYESDHNHEHRYKVDGNLDDKEFAGLTKKACAFHVSAVRTMGGKVWGVLVIDSTDASIHTDTSQHATQDSALMKAAEKLTLLLE